MSDSCAEKKTQIIHFFEILFYKYLSETKSLTPVQMQIRKISLLAKENELYRRITIGDDGKTSINLEDEELHILVPLLCEGFDALLEFADFILGPEDSMNQAEIIIKPLLDENRDLLFETGVMDKILRGRYGDKLPSGVKGLDSILEGGYPKGTSILLEGPTSNEREQLSYQFIKEGLEKNGTVLVVLSHESPGSFRKKMRGYDIDTTDYERRGYIRIVDWYSYKERTVEGIEEKGAVIASSRDLTDLDIALGKSIKNLPASSTRISVADLISAALNLYDRKTVYDFIQSFRSKLEKRNFTSLFLLEKDAHDNKAVSSIYQMMGGVIDLERKRVEDRLSSSITIKKMIGSNVDERLIPLLITRKGVSVLEKGLDEEQVILEFMEIPGLGPSKARNLLEWGFTSLDELKKATITEISQVPGISLKKSKKIREFLRTRDEEDDIQAATYEVACPVCETIIGRSLRECPNCGEFLYNFEDKYLGLVFRQFSF